MGQVFTSAELIRMIEADGWRQVAAKGSHWQFVHPTKPGRVTVPHPRREVAKGTAASILRQAGLK
jgi:predicted RNA binding protein YcfA (HicA-like mRNA interferase family)